jgi:hypothetical protein
MLLSAPIASTTFAASGSLTYLSLIAGVTCV